MDIKMIVDLIQNFGFPICVAVWSLWELKKSWGKVENIQNRLVTIEEKIDKVEAQVEKNGEVLLELSTALKILQAIYHNGSGSDKRK